MESAGIRSFRELANELSAGMQHRNRPAVKTFLIDVRTPPHQTTQDFLRQGLSHASPRRRITVGPLPDSPTVYRARLGKLTMWVDTTDESFWEIHTLDDTATVQSILGSWVAQSPGVEYAWFPQELLQQAAESGEFVGFGLRYTREFFADEPETADALSMRVAGTRARTALVELQRQAAFERTSALSMVRVRDPLSGPGSLAGERITSSLSAQGRITSRGESFERHRAFIRFCAHLYRAKCNEAKAFLGSGRFDESGEGLSGPLRIDLRTPIDDLVDFCGRLFSGGEPFRLWGFPERRGNDLVVAPTYDRVSGEALTIEVASKEMRLYLGPRVPGSFVLRLVSLLQHHHDQRVTFPVRLP
jgi:hypothetical protein